MDPIVHQHGYLDGIRRGRDGRRGEVVQGRVNAVTTQRRHGQIDQGQRVIVRQCCCFLDRRRRHQHGRHVGDGGVQRGHDQQQHRQHVEAKNNQRHDRRFADAHDAEKPRERQGDQSRGNDGTADVVPNRHAPGTVAQGVDVTHGGRSGDHRRDDVGKHGETRRDGGVGLGRRV